MPYDAIEAAVASRIRTHADYSTSNVSVHGDQRILGAGNTRNAILSYGGMRNEFNTVQEHRRTWIVNIDLHALWAGEISTTWSNLNSDRQNLIDTLSQWPMLNGTTGVEMSLVTSGGPNDLGVGAAGRPHYWKETIACEVVEYVNVNAQE